MAFTAVGELLTAFFLLILWNCHLFPRAFSQDPSQPGVAASLSLGLDLRLTYTPRNFNSRVFRHASVGYRATTGKGQWALAASKDWRADGVVSPLREQGTCAASWAMASLASVESAWAITGSSSSNSSSSDGSSESTPSTPIPLSVQQVLSCKGSLNCAGGLPSAALDYVASRTVADGGIYAESDWPYAGEHDTRCRHPTSGEPNQGATATFEQVPDFFGWFGLLLALQQQPVVVGVMGSYPSFQTFTGPSVYSDRSCTGGVVDHAVLVVGYVLPSLSSSLSSSSSSSEEPHWIIRNSWGTAWGNNGDMRMAMVGGTAICEIHSTPPLYPVVASGSSCSSGINPCGGGECVPAPGGDGQQYSCNCPDDFVPIVGIDGSQSCTPVRVCSFYAANPCGVGVCINDGVGGYGCVCPSGWTLAEYAAESVAGAAGGAQRSRTCVRDVEESSTYVVEFENVTCEALASAFGLLVTQLEEQNPTELASQEHEDTTICSNGASIPVDTTLNVTSDSDTPCTVRMSWGEGDDCKSVAKRAEISRKRLTQLNPWLDCDNTPPAGFQVCISTTEGYWNIPVEETESQQQVCTELLALGTPLDSRDSPPTLVEARPGVGYKAGKSSMASTQSYGGRDDDKPLPPAGEHDLCQEVQAAKSLTAAQLFALNPGIYCRNLAPTVVATGPNGEEVFGLVTSPPVCVAGDIILLRKCPAVYRARERETCESITARFFARKPSALAAHNMGWRCINCALYVGRPLCVPAPKAPPATCKKGC